MTNLRDYIAKDSPLYARQFIEKLLVNIEKLETFPNLGRVVPEADRSDVREQIFRGYRIIYLVKSDKVFIVAILHGSQDLTRFKEKPWDES